MIQQTLIIDDVPKSLNELFNMHRMVRAEYKKEISEIIQWLCKEQKIQPIKNPVILQYIITFDKKRNRDVDNYIGGTKFFNDGLKDAGIIPDDNSEVIQAINVAFAQGTEKSTQIIIHELI